MSDSNGDIGPEPAFVLVRPQMGRNIGSAARAMLNFGLERMRVVEPRDGWPNPDAVAMASGAGRVLDQATVHGSVAEAVGDCDYVFATTARSRELSKPIFSPEAAMEYTRQMQLEGRRVAVLFGPERTGLENDDVAVANGIITVPVNPQFASLNLAQCVLLTAYEFRRQSVEVQHEVLSMPTTETASVIEVDKLAEHYEARLEDSGFFFPETKAEGMKIHLRNMWSRMPLTRQDVQMLHGVLRQLLRKKDG